MRLVIARCQVDYAGRLTAHLPMATRLILIKSDGSVSIHADDRAYKPLNWMSPPCSLVELGPPELGHDSALSANRCQPGGKSAAATATRSRSGWRRSSTDSPMNLASTRDSRRTALRRTCRSFSPNILSAGTRPLSCQT